MFIILLANCFGKKVVVLHYTKPVCDCCRPSTEQVDIFLFRPPERPLQVYQKCELPAFSGCEVAVRYQRIASLCHSGNFTVIRFAIFDSSRALSGRGGDTDSSLSEFSDESATNPFTASQNNLRSSFITRRGDCLRVSPKPSELYRVKVIVGADEELRFDKGRAFEDLSDLIQDIGSDATQRHKTSSAAELYTEGYRSFADGMGTFGGSLSFVLKLAVSERGSHFQSCAGAAKFRYRVSRKKCEHVVAGSNNKLSAPIASFYRRAQIQTGTTRFKGAAVRRVASQTGSSPGAARWLRNSPRRTVKRDDRFDRYVSPE